MGESDDILILTGEAMDEDDLKNWASQAGNEGFVGIFQAQKSQIYAICGEHQKGADLAISKGDDFWKKLPCYPLVMSDRFYKGVSLFDVARKTKRRKYMVHAKREFDAVERLVKKGNPNARHYLALLEAELAALHGKGDRALIQYEASAILAARAGFIQDAALINERFGEFLLNEMSDRDQASFRLEEAIKLYQEWGASAKVLLLREQYGDILQTQAC